jgi:hypothetical protein
MACYNTFMYFKSVFQMRRSYALCKGEISTVDIITTSIATDVYFLLHLVMHTA